MLARFDGLKVTSTELLHLDILRFVSSCFIVFHHSKEFLYPFKENREWMYLSSGLALFVDLFFVISGFVIAYVYSDKMNSTTEYMQFIRRRIARLLPLHLATLFLAVCIGIALSVIGIRQNHPPTMSMSCVGSTALLIHSFYDCGGISFNGVSWSISAEFVMYIIFPLLVYWKVKSTLVKLSAPVLLACGLLYYKFIMDGTIGTEAWTNIDGPIRALPSFLFGLALFQGREVISRIPTCRCVLFVSTLAMIFAMFAGAPAMVDIALIYIVSASAVACDVNVRPNKVSVKIASFGQITYSLYMLHGIIIMIIINAFGDKLLHLPAIPMLVLVVVCYAVIFRVAVWSYVFFETPARKWIDQIPFRRQPD